MANNDSLLENDSFLGRGWSFPPEFSKGSNQAEMSAGEKDINESLQILLSTSLGERVMRPRYGADTTNLVFERMEVGFSTLLQERIRIAILNFEARIDVNNIDVFQDPNEGLVQLSISYTIRQTNSRANIVFPFYLIEGTDIAS